jgi:hypothetical protein
LGIRSRSRRNDGKHIGYLFVASVVSVAEKSPTCQWTLSVMTFLSRRNSAEWTLAIALSLAGGCRPEKSTTQQGVFGDISRVEDVDFAPYLATARAIIARRDPPAAPMARPGQRAFVTVWSPGRAPAVGTGLGDDLLRSVAAAARTITEELADGARIQLDIVSDAERFMLTNEMTELLPQLGLRGYVVAAKERVGFVLPTEMLAFAYFDTRSMGTDLPLLAAERLAETLAARAGLERSALDTTPAYRITTTSRIESEAPGPAVPIVRSMPPRPSVLTATELIDSVRAGADYLASAIDDEGRYRYDYRPVADADRRGYGWLRHAGATYALLEAYEELRDVRYLAKAERALAFLDRAYKETPEGAFLSDNPLEEQQKIGGNGLALVALAKHAELTGRRTAWETMRALAAFITRQQLPDGHFRDDADAAREGETPREKAKELFYSSEAILGLLRFYRVDRQPKLLEVARKAADFIVLQRDASGDEAHLVHDHWLTYSLLDLYRETKSRAYADHALKIARSIVAAEAARDRPPGPDFPGTFYHQGNTTAVSTRLEALAANLELSIDMGKDHAWLDDVAMRLACFVRGQQYDHRSSYFVKVPAKALGGIRESLFNNDIRIDYVEHAICAWLHLARALRDPHYRPPAGDRATDP